MIQSTEWERHAEVTEAAYDYIKVQSRAELVRDACAELGEGPVWDTARTRLWWVDILRGRVNWWDPASGENGFVDVGRPVGAVVPRRSGGLLVATNLGFEALDPDTGRIELLVPVEADSADTRMNDGKCDPSGHFWAGTMALDATPGAGALYRLGPNGADQVLSGVTISNGLAWDQRRGAMYFIDTGEHAVDAFDWEPDSGRIDHRRRLVEIPGERGLPDGMAIDADGYLWVALCYGWCLHRYSPAGRLDHVVTLPVSLVTSCAFGGDDLSDLYITTGTLGLQEPERRAQPGAGGVFRLRPGIAGIPAPAFAS